VLLNSNRPANGIRLRAPVILMVLAATAIPVELRPVSHVTVDFGVDTFDVVANVVGFVPVGIVLGELGLLRAVITAAVMSAFAEVSQLAMMYRDCSAIDLASNVIGAFLGAVVSLHWRIRSPTFRINRWMTLVATTVAFALILLVWAAAVPTPSTRGATSPGTLEAYWRLDETSGRVAFDSSGQGLNGRFSNEPKHVADVIGRSVTLDGAKDYIDFGRSTALRLVGSMTISAWIKPTSFPVDDAAIVSQLHGRFGYQLDTTVDRGPRTIGFKLTNACGDLMARYGATPLAVHTWYHVAGVYDAEEGTLDVYLNGKLDNGVLVGSVTGTQHSSRSALYVGKRSDLEGYAFAGSIRDVRIYSFALTNSEIAAVMRGEVIDVVAAHRVAGGVNIGPGRSTDQTSRCAVFSEGDDKKVPAVAATLGVLVAFACVGLWPSASSLLYLFSSFAAGLLLLPAAASTLPSFTLWMIPLVSLAGGASVVVSLRRQNDPDHLAY
jgi:Concanavalin A-like lectin/glucanases superfamily/VanZ like family